MSIVLCIVVGLPLLLCGAAVIQLVFRAIERGLSPLKEAMALVVVIAAVMVAALGLTVMIFGSRLL